MLVLEIAPLPSIKTGAPEEEVSWSISLMFAAVAKSLKVFVTTLWDSEKCQTQLPLNAA